jgi:hypothetical protein
MRTGIEIIGVASPIFDDGKEILLTRLNVGYEDAG